MFIQPWCSLPYSQYTHSTNVVPVVWWKGFSYCEKNPPSFTKCSFFLRRNKCLYLPGVFIFCLRLQITQTVDAQDVVITKISGKKKKKYNRKCWKTTQIKTWLKSKKWRSKKSLHVETQRKGSETGKEMTLICHQEKEGKIMKWQISGN